MNKSEVFTIRVEGVEGEGVFSRGDIALDDFTLSHGTCPPRLLCDFEDGLCDFTHEDEDEVDEKELQWTIGSNGDPSKGNGPHTDHTTGSKHGKMS